MKAQARTGERSVKVTPVFDRNVHAKARVVVNEGGSGSSKTHSLLQLFIQKLFNEKNVNLLTTRKTGPALKVTDYKWALDLLKHYNYYRYLQHNKADRTLYNPFNNNFWLFTSVDDPEKIKSSEWNYIHMEEANEFSYADFMSLTLRLRGENPNGENQMFLSLNPVPCWIQEKLEGREGVRFIPSTYHDNRYIDRRYIDYLEGLKEEDESYYRIYTLGRRAKIKGKIYELTEVAEFPEEFPETVYGIDYGFTNPSVLLEIGIDMENRALYFRERIYERGLTNEDFIKRMKEKVPEENRDREFYADPSEPNRVEETYRAGFNIKPADNNVLDGIDLMNRFTLYTLPWNVNFNREMRKYKRKVDKDGNVLEKPVKFDDHCPDGARYGAFTHLKARLSKPKPVYAYHVGVEREERKERRRGEKAPKGAKVPVEGEVRDAALSQIEKEGAASAGMIAHSTGYGEGVVREQLKAMGLVEHRKNRFVYGEGGRRSVRVPEREKRKEGKNDGIQVYTSQ